MVELTAFEDLRTDNAVHLTQVDGCACLQGGQCRSCNKSFFPVKMVCPYCGVDKPAHIALPTTGNLYSFTTVHVSAGRQTPYHLGYVDLNPAVRVLTTLTGEVARLQLDTPVKLHVDAQGGWSFVPLTADAGRQAEGPRV